MSDPGKQAAQIVKHHVFDERTVITFLDTWTHHQNLSGYLPMKMNKFKKKLGSFIEECFLLRGHN